MLKIGSLFSGIGGLELGILSALSTLAVQAEVVWQAEMDPYARAVLAKHWPRVHRYQDIRDVNEQSDQCDLICGGFPCQDLSAMGRHAGISGGRSGLWSEFVRVLRALQPRFVFVENVPAIRRHLGAILGPLADLGFDAEWDVFSAAEVGAPHRRSRWFLLAWRAATDPTDQRRDGWSGSQPHGEEGREWDAVQSMPPIAGFGRWSPEPGVCRVDDGSGTRLDRRQRRRRVAVLANAVVRQQAAHAFLTLAKRAGLITAA